MVGADEINEDTIFETPLIELDIDLTSGARVLGKVEWFNLYRAPFGGGSVKSRIAKGMLDAAERSGVLTADDVIIEPTSGNTGSEIARLGGNRGYDVEIVMPDNAAGGKIEAVRETGADIHFVDGDRGYDAVLDRCEELIAASPDRYYRPNQYTNPENPGTHQRTTAAELYTATDGTITHFVSGVGTGGTVTGTGRGLEERDPTIDIVGFEPGEPLHAIDGLKYIKSGNHYVPEIYDATVLDRKEYVDTGDAYAHARQLRSTYQQRTLRIVAPGQHTEATIRNHLRVDGQFVVGTSSGAALAAVEALDADGALRDDDLVVVMLCDRGDKYADIPLWEEYLTAAW